MKSLCYEVACSWKNACFWVCQFSNILLLIFHAIEIIYFQYYSRFVVSPDIQFLQLDGALNPIFLPGISWGRWAVEGCCILCRRTSFSLQTELNSLSFKLIIEANRIFFLSDLTIQPILSRWLHKSYYSYIYSTYMRKITLVTKFKYEQHTLNILIKTDGWHMTLSAFIQRTA